MLNTSEIVLVHHSRCGMLAFTDGLLQAGFKGGPARGSDLSWRDGID
jgi:carbonic anhydrase